MTTLPSITSAEQPYALKKPEGFALNKAKHYTDEQLTAVAKEFEAQFISQMLSTMFSTVDTKESLGGSDEEDTYKSMLVSEYGKVIAQSGGLGIADQIKRDMLKHQEI